MGTVVVTDAKYRAVVSAVRVLGRAGWNVVVTQTRGDTDAPPPAFASRYTAETRWLPGTTAGEGYADRLYSLLGEYGRPVLLCGGAATLNAVSWQRDRFREVSAFLIPPPDVLDSLNDKEAVHRRCTELGLPVPKLYAGPPDRYPVVVKPHCGEKYGLHAEQRYRIAENESQWRSAVQAMSAYDPAPLVQEKVTGDGSGASLLLGRNGDLLCALCHRRIREYPASGGPSSCCESVYDPRKVRQAHRLLRSFGFQGLAMVEFKGDYILEVNPRIWGSFPLTEQAGSPMADLYARAASEAEGSTPSEGGHLPEVGVLPKVGRLPEDSPLSAVGPRPEVEYAPWDYRSGVRMRFLLNDTLASLDLLRRGKLAASAMGALDVFRAKEALWAWDDPAPLWTYLRGAVRRRGGG